MKHHGHSMFGDCFQSGSCQEINSIPKPLLGQFVAVTQTVLDCTEQLKDRFSINNANTLFYLQYLQRIQAVESVFEDKLNVVIRQ